MPQFAANLSLLYPELEFLDRFEAAARDGFRAVEYLFPYAYPAQELRARLDANGLQQVLFNAAPGQWDAGERGMAALAGREAEFEASIEQALRYAQVLACPRVHVMSGKLADGQTAAGVKATWLANLRRAAKMAQAQGVDVLIEPLNTRDNPGYVLNYQEQAHQLVIEADCPNLKVQFDLYHTQIMEGDVATRIRRYLPTGRVGHLQIAGVPERHEPDVGELHHAYLFDVIDEVCTACAWNGWIGCEYRPARGAVAGGTSAGLGWMRQTRA